MERSLDDGTDQEPPEGARHDVSEFVEVDPTGRYGRYDEVLGKGAYKTVYKAFDDLDGIEVAWNQVKLQDMVHKGGDMERLYSELHLLKTLKHKNIIKFYNSWVDTRNQNVNFITEIFTSGTLRQYRKKHKHVNLRAIKHWSRQILQGLVYLHSHKPPIIHRDLKCDNVFINGNNGEVKIGDLGLATILRQAPAAHSVIGTPEFMAPELYEEHYNELVDIYSFGMCLLEMLTSEYPYSECANAAQIYKKVTTGKRPAALSKVKDPETRQFLLKCLAAAPQRLHAKELLLDPFLRNDNDHETLESNHRLTMMNQYEDRKCRDLVPEEQYCRSLLFDASAQKPEHGLVNNRNSRSKQGSNRENASSSDSPHVLDSPQLKEGWKRSRDFRIKGRKLDDKKVLVRIRITNSSGGVRYIQFDFDVEVDTAMSVASEMVSELELSDQDVTTIADMIDAEITFLIPDWKSGVSLDGTRASESMNEQPGPILHNSNKVVNDEEIILRDDPSSSTIVSADDIEAGDVHRNEAFNIYGRFEEVDCGQNGADLNHKEQDGSGFLSDYSSEPHEGRGSDTSLEVSPDNRSSVSLASQMLEEIGNDSPSSIVRKTSEHEEDGDMSSECIPSVVAQCGPDYDDNSEVLKFLMLQHERELRLLQSKHEQALLDFKAQRREALKAASTSLIEGKPSLASTDASTETLNHLDGNDESSNKEDDERNTGVQEDVTIDAITRQSTSDFMLSTTESESLSTVQANNISAQAQSSAAVAIDPESSDTISTGGDHRSKIAGEHAVIVDRKDMPIHEHVKPSVPLLTKRESYLELYKGQSNQRDKPVSPKPSEISRTSDGISEEQLKKQQVQKSIADLEAKTLEGLLQSKSKYACNAPKNNGNTTLQNGQASSSGANGRQPITHETAKI